MATAQQTLTRHGLRCLLYMTAVVGLTGCSWLDSLTRHDPPPSQAQTSEAVTQTVPTATGQPIPATVVTVLPAGSSIRAHGSAGDIRIQAGPDSLRTFTWRGNVYRVATQPRNTPYPGAESIGLHYDGALPRGQANGGISKLHYEENVRNFEVPYAMTVWTRIRRLDFSYNNNGLAVGWRRQGDTLHVEVWQFRIAGKTPTQLPGAIDSAINVTAPLVAFKSAAGADLNE